MSLQQADVYCDFPKGKRTFSPQVFEYKNFIQMCLLKDQFPYNILVGEGVLIWVKVISNYNYQLGGVRVLNTNYVTVEFLNVYMKLQLCNYVMVRADTCSHRQNLSTKPSLVSRRPNPVTFLISCSFWNDTSQRRGPRASKSPK